MAVQPARPGWGPSRILVGLAFVCFVVAAVMGFGILIDRQDVEDIVATVSLGLAFYALAALA